MIEEELQEMFKRLIQDKGFEVVKELKNTSPDMIARKDGRLIGIEFKVISGTSFFSQAFGQLMFGKFKHNVSDLWLVVDKRPTAMSKDWIEWFWENNMKIFFLSQDNKFQRLTRENFINCNRRSVITMHEDIMKTLEMHPDGLSVKEIANTLNTTPNKVRFCISGIIINCKLVGGTLKDKVVINGKSIGLTQSKENPQNEDIFYLKQTDIIQ